MEAVIQSSGPATAGGEYELAAHVRQLFPQLQRARQHSANVSILQHVRLPARTAGSDRFRHSPRKESVKAARGCDGLRSALKHVRKIGFPRMLLPLSRAGLHSLGIDYSAGVGRAEKIEEDLRCLGILCPRH